MGSLNELGPTCFFRPLSAVETVGIGNFGFRFGCVLFSKQTLLSIGRVGGGSIVILILASFGQIRAKRSDFQLNESHDTPSHRSWGSRTSIPAGHDIDSKTWLAIYICLAQDIAERRQTAALLNKQLNPSQAL